MKITFNNGDLNKGTIEAINNLIDTDINASYAFKLTRIIKEISSIIESKQEMEKKILTKSASKDENGELVVPKDEAGNDIEGSVTIENVEQYTKDMTELMETENTIEFEKIKFDDLGVKTAKIKDLINLEFLFEID